MLKWNIESKWTKSLFNLISDNYIDIYHLNVSKYISNIVCIVKLNSFSLRY